MFLLTSEKTFEVFVNFFNVRSFNLLSFSVFVFTLTSYIRFPSVGSFVTSHGMSGIQYRLLLFYYIRSSFQTELDHPYPRGICPFFSKNL
jgi:hypothetical protein